MQEKMKILLDKLEIDDEKREELKDVSLVKIIGNKMRDSYTFLLNSKTNIEVETFVILREKLKESYKELKKTSLKIEVEDYSIEQLEKYYKYYLNIKKEEFPLLSLVIENKIKKEENTLYIETSNKAEQLKLRGIERDLIDFLSDAGFNISKIEYTINEDKEKELQTEIEKMKENIEVKKEEKTEEIIKGKEIKGKITALKDIIYEEPNVVVEVEVFDIEEKELTNFNLYTLKITDNTDSMFANVFAKKDSEEIQALKKIKKGSWYRMRGKVQNDNFKHELVLSVYDITWFKKEKEKVVDTAEVKRVELHQHTMMSQMDAVSKLDLGKHTIECVDYAISLGHKAIAITDHNCVQALPIAFQVSKAYNKGKEDKDKFKVINGTEITLVDEEPVIVKNGTDEDLLTSKYIVFDVETTGLSPYYTEIIEIGAVLFDRGEIVEEFDEFINIGHPVPLVITQLTGITDAMLKEGKSEEEVIRKFAEFVGDYPVVAQNAKFDTAYMHILYEKYNLGKFNNPVIDTMELGRTLDKESKRNNLTALAKRYGIVWNEDEHHRANYDARGTAYILYKMLEDADRRGLHTLNSLNELISEEEKFKYLRNFHVNILALSKVGLKNLFKIISLANTKYLLNGARILKSVLNEYREDILVGSGCANSEIFEQGRYKTDEELKELIKYYDYVEVQPPDVYSFMIDKGELPSYEALIEHIKRIIRLCDEVGVLVVATGDVHHTRKEDKIYREIIINQKVPGGGFHPLASKRIKEIPSQHFRTTNEMLENFNFLPEDKAYEIVVTNTNKIADKASIYDVIPQTGGVPFSPKIDNSVMTVTNLVYDKASSIYGENLPHNIEERISKELYGDGIFTAIKYFLSKKLEEGPLFEDEAFKRLHNVIKEGFDAVKDKIREYIKESSEEELTDEQGEEELKKNLGGIIGGGFDVIYLIAQKLVKHSNDDGYIVGSRGSVGSSFVATMMGITEVNPLPAHYVCPNCKHSIFDDEEGNPLGAKYSSGYDLPDKICPKCNTNMKKDGQDMPFATFLGFNADKVPDIDLNFSGEYQWRAHEYTKVLFGVDYVYRAGTIGTVADKTAYGFVKGWCEDKGIEKRSAEIERLATGCTGVKRTTGQHPGGIVVIPGYKEVYDFTPFQYPADDNTSLWRTTHFDYHVIDECVLKLDILGHDDPTMLRMLQDLSGMAPSDVPLDDKETMSIFLSPKALGVTEDQINCPTGTLGIPEFGTKFVIQMLQDTKPTNFSELIKISGLSHGTDVWLGNAQELIRNNVVPFNEVIGCRDDIMVYLMYHGLKPIKAFKIMEFVRKGKASKDPETWKEHEALMRESGIEEWFIDSCKKIKYMFPKAHAAAYVISAFRIAWFKVHHPIWYYAAYFSIRCDDFDIETMIMGYEAIKNKMNEIEEKGFNATNKETNVLAVLHIALEATARGITIAPFDINKSDATKFTIVDDHTLLPPFKTIDGLGDTVAKTIVEEREKKPFLSIEDLQKRGKVSQTLIEKMRSMGLLDNMNESVQLSLF